MVCSEVLRILGMAWDGREDGPSAVSNNTPGSRFRHARRFELNETPTLRWVAVDGAVGVFFHAADAAAIASLDSY